MGSAGRVFYPGGRGTTTARYGTAAMSEQILSRRWALVVRCNCLEVDGPPLGGGLLVGQVSNLTGEARSGWKPDLPADGPVGCAESSRPTFRGMVGFAKTRPTLQDKCNGLLGFAAAVLLTLVGCSPRSEVRLRDEGKSVDELRKMLADSDPEVQARGAFGLSRHGPDASPAVAELTEALKRPTALVRQNAALALGAIGPAAAGAVPAL